MSFMSDIRSAKAYHLGFSLVKGKGPLEPVVD
jgi:hypothetical protein